MIEHSQFLTLLFHFSFTQVALRYCGSKFVPYNTSFFLHFLTEEGHCLLFVVCFGFIIIGEATHTNESVLSPSHTMMLNSLQFIALLRLHIEPVTKMLHEHGHFISPFIQFLQEGQHDLPLIHVSIHHNIKLFSPPDQTHTAIHSYMVRDARICDIRS